MRKMLIAGLLLVTGCSIHSFELINWDNFQAVIDGETVELFTLKNEDAICQITNFRGRVVSLFVPDKTGKLTDIVLGYDSIEGYFNSREPYFGALIGRYTNRIATSVSSPETGTGMEIYTDKPGLQFYGGNFLINEDIGKGKKPYGYRTVLCLETQHFPDSPNHDHFPLTLLKPGVIYSSTCTYKFCNK